MWFGEFYPENNRKNKMSELKMEASQILWELFYDRSMVLGHAQHGGQSFRQNVTE